MKRTFVLLRGLGRESRHWGEFASLLKKQDFCSDIVFCDFPGAGVFYKEKGVHSIRAIVKHLVKYYQEEILKKKPLTLIGMSLGGMVAMEYVSQYPELFSEFVLINSSLGSLSPPYKRVRPSAIPLMVKIGKSKDLVEQEQGILDLTSELKVHDLNILKDHVEIAKIAPIQKSMMLKQIYAGAVYRGPRKSFLTKGLVLYSKADKLVNPECSLSIAKHFMLSHKAHDTAGHDLTLDDPQWSVNSIREFLFT